MGTPVAKKLTQSSMPKSICLDLRSVFSAACLRDEASMVTIPLLACIVSRIASPRHPTVQLAASATAPTRQTQQGLWAAGRLPRGQISPILCEAFVYVSACVCVGTYLRICVCLGICIFSYVATFTWEEDILYQMPLLPELLAGCQRSPAGPPQ